MCYVVGMEWVRVAIFPPLPRLPSGPALAICVGEFKRLALVVLLCFSPALSKMMSQRRSVHRNRSRKKQQLANAGRVYSPSMQEFLPQFKVNKEGHAKVIKQI